MFGKKELENKIKELEEENQNLKQENQKLSESYGKSVSKQYLERIDTLNIRIEELNNDKNRFKEERNNAIKEKENITTEMSELKRKYDLTNENWNNQNQVIENMQAQINVSHKVNEELRGKIEQLQKEIKEKDIEIEAYKNAIQNISVNFNGTIKSTSKKVSKSKGE